MTTSGAQVLIPFDDDSQYSDSVQRNLSLDGFAPNEATPNSPNLHGSSHGSLAEPPATKP